MGQSTKWLLLVCKLQDDKLVFNSAVGRPEPSHLSIKRKTSKESVAVWKPKPRNESHGGIHLPHQIPHRQVSSANNAHLRLLLPPTTLPHQLNNPFLCGLSWHPKSHPFVSKESAVSLSSSMTQRPSVFKKTCF